MATINAENVTSLTFRLATVDDAEHLTRLINAAFRSEKTGQTWLHDEQEKRLDIMTVQATRDIITGDTTVMLVGILLEKSLTELKLDDPRITTCFLRRPNATSEEQQKHAHVSPGAAWLGLLAVSTKLHGKGLGKVMLAGAEKYVKEEWGAKRLEFDHVHTRTELRAWYESQGYQATGQSRDFTYFEGAREVLRGGLTQPVLGKDLI